MPKVIGIDLGTTYSGVAVFDKYPQMIPNKQGALFIPSQVAFSQNQILVGDEARIQAQLNRKNSIHEIKRLMGKKFKDQAVQSDIDKYPFEIVDTDKRATVKVRFNKREALFAPEQISAYILKTLKKTAEDFLKEEVKEAVITVPAYFNNNQRVATKAAGEIAGLNVVKIINEPTAAALAFGYGQDDLNKTILVYDLGGGTFDVSIVKILGREFEVKATGGDTHLGGEDFTYRMVTHLIHEFERKHKLNLPISKFLFERLKQACERAKRKLCSSTDIDSVHVYVDSFYTKENGEKVNLLTDISRVTFESINKDLFQNTIDIVKKCLLTANLSVDKIDDIVLIGGSTRIPKIRDLLSVCFSPEKINTRLYPDEAVALGASIQGVLLSEDNLSKSIVNTKLLDVIPLSLRVRTGRNDIMAVVIKGNSPVPTKVIQRMQTLEDNQKLAVFPIFEGEREFTKDNVYLGEFSIYDLPLGPMGSVLFDVTFEVDFDGILTVSAVETQTLNSGEIKIKKDMYSLSQETIREMIENAKENEEIDKTNKMKALKKRELEQYMNDVTEFFTMKSTMKQISHYDAEECKAKQNEVRVFFQHCENSRESEFSHQLKALKSVCHPHLNNLFKETKGRNIGEPAVIHGEGKDGLKVAPKTLYDVESFTFIAQF